jgi:hypothetical protein
MTVIFIGLKMEKYFDGEVVRLLIWPTSAALAF